MLLARFLMWNQGFASNPETQVCVGPKRPHCRWVPEPRWLGWCGLCEVHLHTTHEVCWLLAVGIHEQKREPSPTPIARAPAVFHDGWDVSFCSGDVHRFLPQESLRKGFWPPSQESCPTTPGALHSQVLLCAGPAVGWSFCLRPTEQGRGEPCTPQRAQEWSWVATLVLLWSRFGTAEGRTGLVKKSSFEQGPQRERDDVASLTQ